jgi:hypothetical protein
MDDMISTGGMKMETKQITPRRMFLTAATCGSAVVVAALATRKQAIVQEVLPPAPANPETSVGYHETEHIRKYYASAAYF